MVINNIQVYTMTDGVYDYYHRHAKNCKNKPKEFIERKLSSLIHNATNIKPLSISEMCPVNRYTFCGFRIIVDEKYKRITRIHWREEDHSHIHPSKELLNKLINTNIALGMDKFANKWLDITPTHQG